MSDEKSVVNEPVLPDSGFVKELIKQWRAQDMHGVWEKTSDAELLAPYILTKETRRRLPVMGNPSPEALWRLELFYNAVGLAIERATGVMVAPMIKMHKEGFGRVALIAGRLVVMSRHLRDAHRFGFESMTQLAGEGDKQVAAGIDMVQRFPEVASFTEES